MSYFTNKFLDSESGSGGGGITTIGAASTNAVPVFSDGTGDHISASSVKIDTGAISNANSLTFVSGLKPTNPAAGNLKLYSKTDGGLYFLNNAGTEVAIGGGGDKSIWAWSVALSGTPASGVIRGNSATSAVITKLVINVDDSKGNSYRPIIEMLNIGDTIGLQNADASNMKYYGVSSVVDSTTYFTINVNIASESDTASFSDGELITVVFAHDSNPFDQSLNSNDPVTFQKVTVLNSPQPAIELKDSSALDISTVNAKLTMLDSNDTDAFSISITDKIALISNTTTNSELGFLSDGVGFTLQSSPALTSFTTDILANAAQFSGLSVISSGSPDMYMKDLGAANIATVVGYLQWQDQNSVLAARIGMDSAGGLEIINSNTAKTLLLQSNNSSLTIDDNTNLSTFTTDVEAKDITVVGQTADIGTLTQGFYIKNNLGDFAAEFKSAIGGLSIKNYNTNGFVTLGAGTSSLRIDDTTELATLNTSLLLTDETADIPTIRLKTTDGATTGRLLFSNSSDIIDASLTMDSGVLTLSNDITGNVNVFSNAKGLIVNSVADTATFNTASVVTTAITNTADIATASITGTTITPTQDFPDTTTSNVNPTTAGYNITSSSDFSVSNEAWYAFDSDTSTTWTSNTGYSSGVANVNTFNGWPAEWLKVQSPELLSLKSYSIRVVQTSSSPVDFRIYGSVDNVSWTTVDEQTGVTDWVTNEQKTYTLSAPSAQYFYYVLAINTIVNPLTTVTRIADLNFVSVEDCPTFNYLDIPTCVSTAGNLTCAKRITCDSLTFPKPMAEMYWDGNTTQTIIGDSINYFIIAGAASISDWSQNFTHTTPNKLTYTGNKTMLFHAGVSFSFASAGGGAAIDWYFAFFVDGAIVPGSICRRRTSGTEYGSTAVHKFLELSNGDEVQFRVKNTTNTTYGIVSHFNMFLVAMPNDVSTPLAAPAAPAAPAAKSATVPVEEKDNSWTLF